MYEKNFSFYTHCFKSFFVSSSFSMTVEHEMKTFETLPHLKAVCHLTYPDESTSFRSSTGYLVHKDDHFGYLITVTDFEEQSVLPKASFAEGGISVDINKALNITPDSTTKLHSDKIEFRRNTDPSNPVTYIFYPVPQNKHYIHLMRFSVEGLTVPLKPSVCSPLIKKESYTFFSTTLDPVLLKEEIATSLYYCSLAFNKCAKSCATYLKVDKEYPDLLFQDLKSHGDPVISDIRSLIPTGIFNYVPVEPGVASFDKTGCLQGISVTKPTGIPCDLGVHFKTYYQRLSHSQILEGAKKLHS